MALIFLHGQWLTRSVLDSVRESTKSPVISQLAIPSTCARTIYTTKLSDRFRMELSNLEDGIVDVPLQLRKSLEDGCRSIHTVSGEFCDQDGHEKCTRARLFLGTYLPSTVHSHVTFLRMSLLFACHSCSHVTQCPAEPAISNFLPITSRMLLS
jgi:hypothetical protein